MAIVGKLQLVDNIKREITDNSTGDISPRDVRHNLLDIVDSVHLFTDDNKLFALNFATPDTRTTRAGDLAIGKLHLDGYNSVDNSAYGYSALAGNYTGFRNTAVGSHALGCNVYGADNVAIGVNSIAANVYGSGNVSVGNYALHTNKEGDFNIAIGHGAGYYVGNNSSHNLYVGTHPVNGDSLCDDASGSGVNPLLHGDLQNLRLGVACQAIAGRGTLQVAGHVAPSGSCEFDLGLPAYKWNDLYLCNSINDQVFVSGGPAMTVKGDIVPYAHATYSLGAAHPKNWWKDGFFKNITVSGTADIEVYNYTEINSCIYECRTLYLASSGDICDSGGAPCGYLHDEQLEGAGLVVQSSGTEYRRNYEWLFKAPDASLKCLDSDTPYSRATWNSNISVHIASGSHLKSDRVIGYDQLALVNCAEGSGQGVFLTHGVDFAAGGGSAVGDGTSDILTPSDFTYFGPEHVVKKAIPGRDDELTPYVSQLNKWDYKWSGNNWTGTDNDISNISTFNFFFSGIPLSHGDGQGLNTRSDASPYTFTGDVRDGVRRGQHVVYSNLGSGNVVGQRLLSRTASRRPDPKYVRVNDHPATTLEMMYGFGLEYIDEMDSGIINTRANTNQAVRGSQVGDRLELISYDGVSVNSGLPLMTWMRGSGDGTVGITDIDHPKKVILPETIFNVQATGDAIIRNTAGTYIGNTSALQLLCSGNQPREGLEIDYCRNRSRADISLFYESVKSPILTITNTESRLGLIGIHNTTPNEVLTISSGVNQPWAAAISLQERKTKPSKTSDYGKLYVKPKTSIAYQTQAAYLLDDGGNEFDLTLNKYDMNDGRAVYTDDNGNTFAGKLSNKNRSNILANQSCNTAYGYKALYDVSTGDKNTAIGCQAGVGVTTGYDNVLVGDHAGEGVTTGHGNIAIGYRLLDSVSSNISNTILIGGDGLGDGLSSPADDYTFLLGIDNSLALLKGVLGPTSADTHLFIPKSKFSVTSQYNTTGYDGDRLTIRHDENFFGGGQIGSIIEKVDTNSDYPNGGVAFVFTTLDPSTRAVVNTNTLMTLRHTGVPMSTTCSFPSTSNPTVEVKGDLNLQGSVNFCDGTNLNSVSGIVIYAGSGLRSAIHPTLGNTQFHVDIEELPAATSLSTITDTTSYMVMSTSDTLGKINIADLSSFITPGQAKIQTCYGGVGQNHIFTNTSLVENTACYNDYFGYQAGSGVKNSSHANFIGTQAGASAGASTAVDGCSYANWMGYKAGYETQAADYSVFIGQAAGYRADNSRFAVFIGDSAGMNAQSSRSIGIGDNALESVTGINNLEITAGVGGGMTRVIGAGEISNKIAIGTCIAGDMGDKRISIGEAVLEPSGVLDVRARSSADTKLQTWFDHTKREVAYLDSDGNLYIRGSVNTF
jgi:hypothetical protein